MTDLHGAHGLGDPRYDPAWAFVIENQGAQVRKGTDIPYTTHLRGVARGVLDGGGTPEEVIGGMLHDIVEDTPILGDGHSVDVDEVRQMFGPRVAEVVEFCTDAAPAAGEIKAPWRERKTAHFEHLLPADPGTLRVVVADKTDNLTGQIADLNECDGDPAAFAESLARFKGGFAGTLWYYRGMRAAMGDKLAGLTVFTEFTDKIEEFAGLWTPVGAELERRDRVRAALDDLDPQDVGSARVGESYYAIESDELARRASAPGAPAPADVVDELVTTWYGKEAWPQTVLDRVTNEIG